VLHEPRVLFLDEPTSGLDPEVAREVRELIAGFRREGRTVLLCTHNLAEAEQLADLVGILRRRMLVFGPPGSLGTSRPEVALTLRGDPAPLLLPLRAVPGVTHVVQDGTVLRIGVAALQRETPVIVREVVRLGGELLAVHPVGLSLEAAYLRAVREEAG